MTVDEETIETLRRIHTELELDVEAPYDLEADDWTKGETVKHTEFFDLEGVFDKVVSFADKLYRKVKKSKKVIKDIVPDDESDCKPGNEMARELTDAWNLFTRGGKEIASKDVGYVLRILGQNPTEDDIVAMVMKADCDWNGMMGRTDFLLVGEEILKSSVDQMDDLRAAFRVFDYDNNGSISKEELREAMVNFGQRCTDEEFDAMFAEADKNMNGRIDFDEFVEMMIPSTSTWTKD